MYIDCFIWHQENEFCYLSLLEIVTVNVFKFKTSIFVLRCEPSLFIEEVTHRLDFFSNKEDGSVFPMALLNAKPGLRIEISTIL